MGNGMLSQEEIDALLSGTLDADPIVATEEQDNKEIKFDGPIENLTNIELDALGEIANISMGTAATTLSQLLGKRVEITTPMVDIITPRKLIEDYPVPHVLIDVKYKKGIEGSNLLVLSRHDGSIIVDLMMGGDGLNPTNDLNEMQMSGISEAMNQMMGSAATSMSTMFNAIVDITPPSIQLSDVANEESLIEKNFSNREQLVRISFKMVVEGIIDSILLQVLPVGVAKKMIEKLLGSSKYSQNNVEQSVQVSTPKKHTEAWNSPPAPPEQQYDMPNLSGSARDFYGTKKNQEFKEATTTVQPVHFAPLARGGTEALPNNLNLIYDVPLQVSVELGKASKTIKEILELGPGSVVELDKLAGEPVDMIVNGKLVAKCEVVVINETFGIRITEIVNTNERVAQIN